MNNGPDPTEESGGCRECDPRLLDKLRCDAQGTKAQADYNTAHLAELDTARTQYEAARHAYSEARRSSRPTVTDLGTQLTNVIDQLACLVGDNHVITLLDESFDIVRARLEGCYPVSGCGFEDDCDFESDRGCEPDDIEARIAAVTKRTDAAKVVFADLIAEPAGIATRLAALQAEVNAIVAGMASDSRTVDFRALYADAKVAQWHQQNLYRGFADVNEYVDCLCRALTCQLKGHAAIAHLMGRQAIRQCHHDAEAARCARLRDHTADEVMSEFYRLRHRHREDESEPDRDHGGDRGRDDDGDGDRARDRDRDGDRDRDRARDRERDREWDRDRDPRGGGYRASSGPGA